MNIVVLKLHGQNSVPEIPDIINVNRYSFQDSDVEIISSHRLLEPHRQQRSFHWKNFYILAGSKGGNGGRIQERKLLRHHQVRHRHHLLFAEARMFQLVKMKFFSNELTSTNLLFASPLEQDF